MNIREYKHKLERVEKSETHADFDLLGGSGLGDRSLGAGLGLTSPLLSFFYKKNQKFKTILYAIKNTNMKLTNETQNGSHYSKKLFLSTEIRYQ